jgi:hypothetical protein
MGSSRTASTLALAWRTRFFDYTPNRYRMMLDREGAMATARKLVFAGSPSEGFTRLWELKRLDLTVESLVLQEQWRKLFDEEMLTAAQRQLGQFNRLSGIGKTNE